jgi:hydrogenase maturation factor
MSRDGPTTVVIPSESEPPCLCGKVKVAVFQDGLEDLMDNMGCELGLQFVAGPFCPECESGKIAEARSSAEDGGKGSA